MEKYRWRQLSQWDIPKKEYFTKYDIVKSGLSEATCIYLLIEEIDTGNGYISVRPINKKEVTNKMLEIAGNFTAT